MIDVKKQFRKDFTEEVAEGLSEDVSPLKKRDYVMSR